MPSCSVRGCSNRTGFNVLGGPVHFFTFPKDQESTMKWMKACNKYYVNLSHARVCSIHFKPECYKRDPRIFKTGVSEMGRFIGRVRVLHDDAVPTEYLNFDPVRRSKSHIPKYVECDKDKAQTKHLDCKPIRETKKNISQIHREGNNSIRFKNSAGSTKFMKANTTVLQSMKSVKDKKKEYYGNLTESTPGSKIKVCKASEMGFDLSPNSNKIEIFEEEETEEDIIMYTPDNEDVKLVKKKSDQLRLQDEIIKDLHKKLKEKEIENDKLRRKVELLEDVLKVYFNNNGELKKRVSKT